MGEYVDNWKYVPPSGGQQLSPYGPPAQKTPAYWVNSATGEKRADTGKMSAPSGPYSQPVYVPGPHPDAATAPKGKVLGPINSEGFNGALIQGPDGKYYLGGLGLGTNRTEQSLAGLKPIPNLDAGTAQKWLGGRAEAIKQDKAAQAGSFDNFMAQYAPAIILAAGGAAAAGLLPGTTAIGSGGTLAGASGNAGLTGGVATDTLGAIDIGVTDIGVGAGTSGSAGISGLDGGFSAAFSGGSGTGLTLPGSVGSDLGFGIPNAVGLEGAAGQGLGAGVGGGGIGMGLQAPVSLGGTALPAGFNSGVAGLGFNAGISALNPSVGAGLDTVASGLTPAQVASGATSAATPWAPTTGINPMAPGDGTSGPAGSATPAAPVGSTTTAPASPAAASTGLGLKDVASGLTTAGTLAGAVTAINAATGDPLGLNEGTEKANQAAIDAANASAEAQRTLTGIAKDQWDYYKKNYQPLETSLINQAATAGSPDEFARTRGAANADVTGAYDIARKNAERRLQGYGLNPASPAYQSGLASTDLAEGATKAGALTGADNLTRNLAYSKALDVVGLGRNIPAQSAASSANAANAATSAANVANQRQIAQNAQSSDAVRNLGYGLDSLSSVAQKWFGGPSVDAKGMDTTGWTVGGANWNGANSYADGGRVIDAERTGSSFDAVKSVMMRHGLNDSAASRARRAITPHMKVFASGGGVGRQGMEMDESNMGMPNDVSMTNQPVNGAGTETSDSIPARIDGQEEAALSSGEFVMSAPVLKMTGEEILAAINDAGLRKRQMGLDSRTSNDVPLNSGAQAYARGGRVKRYACAGL